MLNIENHRIDRTIALLLSAVLTAALLLAGLPGSARAESHTSTGAAASNAGAQNYSTYGSVVRSCLVSNSDGTLMRVQASADGKSVIAETYGSDFTLRAAKTIAGELNTFGGFYTDGTYNFLVFAQSNKSESDSTEVFRVVKYDRGWNRLAAAGIFGSNTYIPLDAGSLRMTEAGGILYVRTCHEMYGGSGLHHQANMTFAVSVAAMQVTFNNCQVSNVSTGYVSHSFNQFIQADGGDLVMADHGDAYPRAIVLTRCSQTSPTSVSSVNVLNISGSAGNNVTGASLGGLETSSSSCLTAGNSVDQSRTGAATRNVFLAVTNKNSFSAAGTSLKWITTYPEGGAYSASTPQLVKLGSDSFLLLWQIRRQTVDTTQDVKTAADTDLLEFVFLDGRGNELGRHLRMQARLSDCQPVRDQNGRAVWFAASGASPVFHVVDLSKIGPDGFTTTVKFDACGGTVSESSRMVHYTAGSDTAWTLPVPVRSGYGFDGWYTQAEGGEKLGDTVPNICDLTCYAHWYPDRDINGVCGDNVAWTLNAKSGVLTVSGSGEMESYWARNELPSWYSYRGYIRTLIVKDGVTAIGDKAFGNCENLQSVTLPASLRTIGSEAFEYCPALGTVSVPNGTTEIRDYAFFECSGLGSVTMPASLTGIGESAFEGCTGLRAVSVPGGVTETGAGAFSGCTALRAATIGSGVKSIGASTFRGCTALCAVTLPDTVTDIGEAAFSGCSALRRAILSEKLTGVGTGAFSGCTAMKSATVPASVTSIGNYAFLGCTQLQDVYFRGSAPTAGTKVFQNCSAALVLHYPGTATGFGSSWSGCRTAVLTASGTARISNLTIDAGAAMFDYDHAADGRRYTCIVTRYRNGKMISCLKTDGVKLTAGCNRIAADGGEACDVCKLFVLDESSAPAFEALSA